MLNVLSPIAGLSIAIIMILALFIGLKMARSSNGGILKYYFYAILISNAVAMFLTQRDFSNDAMLLSQGSVTSSALGEWFIRFASLLTMLAALERTIHFFQQNKLDLSRATFALILIFLWIGNLLIPTALTSGESLQISYIYSLALSIGIALNVQKDRSEIILHARNAILAFIVVSWVATVISPHQTLDFGYLEGYIPGLPRFYGLAPHATLMGLISAVSVWLLITYPFSRTNLNRFLIFVSLVTLVVAQSKTVILAFFIGLLIILYYQAKDETHSRNIDQLKRLFFSIAFLGTFVLLPAIIILLIVVDFESSLYRVLGTDTMHKLSTLTGRDVIWEIAIAEFISNPIFGYGAGLFSPEHRIALGMSYATHGHNQFIDALGRAGLLGIAGFIFLYAFLFIQAMKQAKQTHGLSLSLFALLFIYSMTAVPITLNNIGVATFVYYLLLIVISAGLGNEHDKSTPKI